MARSLQQLAQEALAVQDACNLSGVVTSFARALKDLWEHCPQGTDQLNQHPIVVLWADKVASLAGIQYLGHEAVTGAYTEVYRLRDGKEQ